MIYRSVSTKKEIRQGDIFHSLSFVLFDLEDLSVIQDNDRVEQTAWKDITKDEIMVIANLEKVYAIVMTQDCDCLQNEYISLIVIQPWNRNIKSNKSWMKNIITLNREPSKMYLPQDEKFNIPERMVIDFSTVFHILRNNLESLRNYRLCRLNREALEHFREKLAFYFHRYAFDEHYPLNAQEMKEYETWRDAEFPKRSYQKLNGNK